MKFLVATHSYLGVAHVADDLSSSEFEVWDRDYWYGSDVFADGRVIACKRNEPMSKRSTTGLRLFMQDGRSNDVPILAGASAPRTLLAETWNKVIDVHQATVIPKSPAVTATSTATNQIYRINLDDVSFEHFDFPPTAPYGDYNHINSISFQQDEIYVVFHNLARKPSEIRIFNADFEHQRSIRLPHYSIHNCEPDGDIFWYNASDNGAIICGQPYYNGGDIHLEIDIIPVGGQWHPKGMALAEDFVVSGYSEHAVDTPRRFVSESGLVFVDRKTHKLEAMVELHDGAAALGNINEVRYMA